MNNSVKTNTKNVVQLAAERYNCYPGETVTFHLKFKVADTAGVNLQAVWPKVATIVSYQLPEGVPALLPTVAEVDQDILLMIPLEEYFNPNQDYQIDVQAQVNTFYLNQHLHTRAEIIQLEAEKVLASESVRIAVYGKGRYLKNLPEIYDSDEFMSRFLMLFESFWKPIDTQINQIHHYFDPQLTPEVFIPWLATWVGLPIDDFLPLNRTRNLLNNALNIFQLRGTVQALQIFMEIFTESQVKITEHRADNFTLGEQNRLGLAHTLGVSNQPKAVTIEMKIKKSELERSQLSRTMYKQKMKDVIRSMVPAHVQYDVHCEFRG